MMITILYDEMRNCNVVIAVMRLFLGLAPHLLLYQSEHWKVQADRERCEGVGAVSPGDHRVDEIRLLQCKIT